MYNVPWLNGRIYQSPVGLLSASFLLRPNTMFHPEGEWSVRLILSPLYAYKLRQMIAPAHDDVAARARALHENLPVEQQVNKPFKENPYWQAAPSEGGLETENFLFTFRLPTVLREPTAAAAARTAAQPAPRNIAGTAGAGGSTAAGGQAGAAGNGLGEAGRRKMVSKLNPLSRAARGETPQAERAPSHEVPFHGAPEPIHEVATRIPLLDALGDPFSGLDIEPDGWDASVSFSIHQYWLRSFGAGVTLRLHAVHLLGQHQKTAVAEPEGEPDLPLPIAL